MPLISDREVRTAARTRSSRLQKSFGRILAEDAAPALDSFDIFLSHSSNDEELLVGVIELMNRLGLSVYIDRIVDPHLSPDKVTAATAQQLRNRMRQSSALLYLHSAKSSASKWMPWELGFFDGLRDRVAILPVAAQENELDFYGQEYLTIYPYADVARAEWNKKEYLWVNTSRNVYALFSLWVQLGEAAIKWHPTP